MSSSDEYTKQDNLLADANVAASSTTPSQSNEDVNKSSRKGQPGREAECTHQPAVQVSNEIAAERYVSVKFLCERYDLSRQTIWRRVKSCDDFPKPVKFSQGATRWKLSDVLRYERALESTLEELL